MPPFTAVRCFSAPRRGWSAVATEITWEDLIPPGVPYGEIIANGEFEEAHDIWRPIFDENATKVVSALDGKLVKLPGYSIPLAFDGDGVTEFILAPYMGACIHVPPPPANQLVHVTTRDPYPSAGLFDAIWVVGTIETRAMSTELAEIGYALAAIRIEAYEWD